MAAGSCGPNARVEMRSQNQLRCQGSAMARLLVVLAAVVAFTAPRAVFGSVGFSSSFIEEHSSHMLRHRYAEHECPTHFQKVAITNGETVTAAGMNWDMFSIEMKVLPGGGAAEGLVSRCSCGGWGGGFLVDRFQNRLAFFQSAPRTWRFGPLLPVGQWSEVVVIYMPGFLSLTVNKETMNFDGVRIAAWTKPLKVGIQDSCNPLRGQIRELKIRRCIPDAPLPMAQFAAEATGEPGQPGRQGNAGSQGTEGPGGFVGRSGVNGADGMDGAQGRQGITGLQGPQGPPGRQGGRGARGDPGDQGAQGVKGPKGIDGRPGERGPPGARGPQGEIGPPGDDGVKGPDGEQGATGDRGLQGPQGAMGEPGQKGMPGVEGRKGHTGLKGATGQWPEGERKLRLMLKMLREVSEAQKQLQHILKRQELKDRWAAITRNPDAEMMGSDIADTVTELANKFYEERIIKS